LALAPTRLLLGITEDNANLLGVNTLPQTDSAFAVAQTAFSALRPRFVRLLINWAKLQPQANQLPALAANDSGCLRALTPCAPYAGLAGELAALASRQRAGENVQPIISIYGTPSWAAQTVSACGRGRDTFSAALSTFGLAAYRDLISDILALGRAQGVALPYFAPWNEPNSSAFISPQHPDCQADAPSLAVAAYAQTVLAMQTVLHADAAPHQMLLGEFMSSPTSTANTTSISAFVAATPEDVLCASNIWSVHDYAQWGAHAANSQPVKTLEAALDARGGCAAHARIWVTETGVGGPYVGDARSGGDAGERAGCRALASKLDSYLADARVDVVLQYSFRDDNLFPVGLINTGLTHLYPTYYLWLAWAQRTNTLVAAPLPAQCAN
jgi:hypothetical protein